MPSAAGRQRCPGTSERLAWVCSSSFLLDLEIRNSRFEIQFLLAIALSNFIGVKAKSRSLAPQTHPERKKRAWLGMTRSRRGSLFPHAISFLQSSRHPATLPGLLFGRAGQRAEQKPSSSIQLLVSKDPERRPPACASSAARSFRRR